MYAEIICVGNELLSGATVNTNTVFLARNLGLMGFDVHRQSVVGDVEQDIIDAVRAAGARSHIVILTGGLGPTQDDKTKEAVAKAFNLTLVESAAVLYQIKSFFEQRGREITQNNFKQAMVIQGGDVLTNPNGTAPGLLLQTDTQAIAMLPGPPAEMEAMFENELKPRLERMRDDFSTGASLHVFGIGESDLEERVRDLLYDTNPSAALYAKPGEVYIDIVAHGRDEKEAEELLSRRITDFEQRVGENIYSEDGKTLAEMVVGLLSKYGKRIAVAESVTGGLMASRITAVPGASKVFDYGLSAYGDWVKTNSLGVDKGILRRFSAVSSAAAAEMAKGAREKGSADIGVGITGIAGPTTGDYIDRPVGLVYIAVADKSRVVVKQFNFSNMRSRDTIRELSVLSAFDMVRRFITKLDIEDSFRFGYNQLADIEREGRPRKSSSPKNQRRVALMVMVLVGVLGLFGIYQAIRNDINASVYSQLRDEYLQADTDGSVAVVGFDNLSSRNPDTVGWLSVGDDVVNTVVVQGRDDGYYADHDFDGNRNALGCVYVDQGINLRDEPDNIILYGSSSHKNEQFAGLQELTQASYLSDQYLINFNNIYGNANYKIVAVFYANTNEAAGEVQAAYLNTHFDANNSFQDFVVDIKMRSVVTVDVDIITGDTFLTLVTDVSDWDGARLVVVARRVRQGESTEVSEVLFSRNIAAAYPEKWYEVTNTNPVYNAVVERDRWTNWLIYNERNYQTDSSGQSSGGVVSNTETPYYAEIKDGDIVITVMMNGSELTDSPLNIVSRMVAHEIGTDAPAEATKAQAIACATWLRREFDTGLVPVVQGNAPNEQLVNLVAEVIDIGLFYEGEIAYTPYFEISSGYTYTSADIFGEAYPYLISVNSSYDYLVPGYSRQTNISQEAVRARIEITYGITLSDNFSNWVRIINRTEGGVVKTVNIDNQIMVSGTEFAFACMSLRSANFTMTTYSSSISFTTLGYGYGVGMSKEGAKMYATNNNWSYQDILAHYYPGTNLGALTW